jgi:hypothetical protein
MKLSLCHSVHPGPDGELPEDILDEPSNDVDPADEPTQPSPWRSDLARDADEPADDGPITMRMQVA